MSRREVARYCAQALANGESTKKVTAYIAAYLSATRSVRQADILLREIEKQLANQHNHTTVHIRSAHAVSTSLQKSVLTALGLDAKTHVEVDSQVDEDLLGGVVVSTAEKEFDGSLQTAMKRLKTLGV